LKRQSINIIVTLFLGLITLFSCNDFFRTKKTVFFGPSPMLVKPKPITMDELTKKKIKGVAVYEITDYGPAHYKNKIPNTIPHADHNPHRSFIVKWENYPQMMVFNHEASYCPWLELPNGLGLCNQFFEGNIGWGELFNQNGRKERNSFVDVIVNDPNQVWLRWNYFCVNKIDDSVPALRGTEDYITYPNGLIWRRLTYESLMPDTTIGYSWQPLDFFAVAPHGTEWKDLFPKDPNHNDYLIVSVIDIYSDNQYDKFWDDNGNARHNGTDETLRDISKSKGIAIILTSKTGYEFVVFGNASGCDNKRNQIVDHSFLETGGWGWNAACWDHWPIGWLNSQTHNYEKRLEYPYHFGPVSHYFVNKPMRNSNSGDYLENMNDMELNKWSESHVFYTLSGVAKDIKTIREIGIKWLDQGELCASPESISKIETK